MILNIINYDFKHFQTQNLVAWMEFLLAKGLIAEAYLSRLPVGHTHEDIDGCFGTLASWFGNINIQTPQQYKEEIIKAFNGESSKLKCSFLNIL